MELYILLSAILWEPPVNSTATVSFLQAASFLDKDSFLQLISICADVGRNPKIPNPDKTNKECH
jgi:hypothetical protein